jgi:hypothetical protein
VYLGVARRGDVVGAGAAEVIGVVRIGEFWFCVGIGVDSDRGGGEPENTAMYAGVVTSSGTELDFEAANLDSRSLKVPIPSTVPEPTLASKNRLPLLLLRVLNSLSSTSPSFTTVAKLSSHTLCLSLSRSSCFAHHSSRSFAICLYSFKIFCTIANDSCNAGFSSFVRGAIGWQGKVIEELRRQLHLCSCGIPLQFEV